ncbi:MAG: hypothetical protein WCK69_02890 [Candidatus Saccharibacteria bacterium]
MIGRFMKITNKLSKIKKTHGLIIAGVVIVSGLFVYEVVLPNKYATDYISRTETAKKELLGPLKAMSDTTYNPVFASADTTAAADLANLALVATKINAAQEQLKTYKKSLNSLKSMPLSGYFIRYKMAKSTKQRDLNALQKISKTTDQYKELVEYMQSISKVADTLDKSPIESTIELPKLATALREFAKNAKNASESIKKLQVPTDMKTFNDNSQSVLVELATATEVMANAIDSMNVDGITSSGIKVEAAMLRLETLNEQVTKLVDKDSQRAKDVRALTSTLYQ